MTALDRHQLPCTERQVEKLDEYNKLKIIQAEIQDMTVKYNYSTRDMIFLHFVLFLSYLVKKKYGQVNLMFSLLWANMWMFTVYMFYVAADDNLDKSVILLHFVAVTLKACFAVNHILFCIFLIH